MVSVKTARRLRMLNQKLTGYSANPRSIPKEEREDIAMLLADDKGADVIVAVGTHVTLVEFLDKGRSGMASTFLTRLRVGGKLVDAKGVSRLYRQRISNAQLAMLVVSGLVALVVALMSTAAGQTLFGLTGAWMDDVWSWILGLFASP